MGTGVVIDERGYILTNQHVVDKVQGIEVFLADGSVLRGGWCSKTRRWTSPS